MDRRRKELACLLALAAIFMVFTWRGLTMFFSGDDLMNMYKAWTTPALKLWKAQLLPWMPLARPLGAGIYRIFYTVFGFHPLPLYIFCWLLLVGNVFLSWRFFRAIVPSGFIALTAVSLTLVHGLFQDLYLSAGTIYDRLCFLFTLLAVIEYARFRRQGGNLSLARTAWLCVLCMMAMNSKESGAAVPAILFCYECIYYLPDVWRGRRMGAWIRSIAPFYCVMGCALAAFILGRIPRAEGLVGNPAYQAHYGIGLWLTNLTEYFNILLYRHLPFNSVATAITLIAMLALALFLRNRAMLFGLAYFLVAITPVAVISARQGYVLYVPFPGFGLYFAALLWVATSGSRQSLRPAVFVAVTALMVWIHAAHWPERWDPQASPQFILSEKMRRNYPTMKPGAKILFVDDYTSGNGYDTMFNLRLLYNDPQIEVFRLRGPALQQPDPDRPTDFDHVFTTTLGTYVELDRRNVPESIKFNTLQDYAPGRYFDVDRADRLGYPVSGVLASDRRGDGWWTTRSAKLKFDLYPADAILRLKFGLPESITAGGAKRNLSVLVSGDTVGTIALTKVGDNDVEFAVPARAINPSGFTILQLDVDNPYVKAGDQDHQEYGVVLLQAGFEYARK